MDVAVDALCPQRLYIVEPVAGNARRSGPDDDRGRKPARNATDALPGGHHSRSRGLV